MPELIVLGLDGANWDLIDPWIEQGYLPNIAALRENGVSTDSISCMPPVTCPNWRSYSTGKNPGKLGVYWWEMINKEERSVSIPDSKSFKSSDFWDYLNDEGISTGIMNLPMTYPPFDVDGFMIAGGPGSSDTEYALPKALNAELDRSGYRLHPERSLTSCEDYQSASSIVNLIDGRLSRFEDILKKRPVEMAHCTVFYINNLQHYFWRGEPVKDAWEVVDNHIGTLRESFPDTNLILMSDHGCNKIDTVFHINTWLENQGYLITDDSVDNLLHRVGVNQQRIVSTLQKLGMHQYIPSVIKEPFRSVIPQDDEGIKRKKKINKINWDKSKAIASGQGLVYVLDESYRDEIITKLSSLSRDTNGKPVANVVCRKEEVYEGPYLDAAPDIIFEQGEGLHTSGAVGNNQVFSSTSHWKAENDLRGLFLASGPDVRKESLSGSISITDIFPTILDFFGCEIPKDIDGRTLSLSNSDEPAMRDPIIPEYVSKGTEGDTRERLRDLGYIQ
ncbi:alkaline phosphatase family protein [Halorarius halobius]|uniref:alkaline phosphatase family protein n=1 Tax=Halorarius halobius TaxID=2962671 RepID=UPI0020CECAFD|nr:alkaline phosphatase family protein [Halorarius halobius]